MKNDNRKYGANYGYYLSPTNKDNKDKTCIMNEALINADDIFSPAKKLNKDNDTVSVFSWKSRMEMSKSNRVLGKSRKIRLTTL